MHNRHNNIIYNTAVNSPKPTQLSILRIKLQFNILNLFPLFLFDIKIE